MTKLTVVDAFGAERDVEAVDGLSIMEVLRPLDIGIEGECEGSVACATCHVWIDESWVEQTGEPSDAEADMLDCAFDTSKTSRLSCQINISASLDGCRILIPRR